VVRDAAQPGLGSAFVKAVDEAFARVIDLPDASTPVPGVPSHIPARRVFVKRFPYTVIFISIDDVDDELVVLAVAHMKRRPGYWHWRALR